MNTAFQFSDNWKDAKEWAIAMRDTYLVQFYGKYSLNGRYVFIEKSACSDILQKRLAIDTIYTSAKTGGSICVEEKSAGLHTCTSMPARESASIQPC